MHLTKSGSALVVATITVTIITILCNLFMTEIAEQPKLIDSYEATLMARYACEGALEEVKNLVKDSSYDAEGNIWLRKNSSPEGKLAIKGLKINNIPVDVTIYTLENKWHRVVASTQVGNVPYCLAMEVREVGVFAQYMFFTGDDPDVYAGPVRVQGAVHTNKNLVYIFGGARMYGPTTAVQSIYYFQGASPKNVYFYDYVNGNTEPIKIPPIIEIPELETKAQGVYKVTETSPPYQSLKGSKFNTEIELLSNQVKITVMSAKGTVSDIYPLPANGLIYVDGPITSLKGDIYGRLTIATTDKVFITGKIRYVDQDGDRAYVLTKDGKIIEDTPPGVAWTTRNGYYYQPNPEYNPPVPSALGIMATKDIIVTSSAPYNMEQHAAIYSAKGGYYCDTSEKKGNMRWVGSFATAKIASNGNLSGYGWTLTLGIIYDRNLMVTPPPSYAEIKSPIFSSYRKF